MGGGPMGMMNGEREMVVAEWTPSSTQDRTVSLK
jgi:hypothetical protein